MSRMRFDLILAFASGIVVPIAAAFVAHVLTQRAERRRLVAERRFDIYMKLCDLHGHYFWFTTAELHKEPVPDEVRRTCRTLAWQVADKLRSVDEIQYLDETLDVLFGSRFETAQARYEGLSRLVDLYGATINPRYSRKMEEISAANIRALASGEKSSAPGATWVL